MGPVNVRIGHQNDFVIAKFRNVKIIFSDSSSQGLNQKLDFLA